VSSPVVGDPYAMMRVNVDSSCATDIFDDCRIPDRGRHFVLIADARTAALVVR
jgi:hypothetical protein